MRPHHENPPAQTLKHRRPAGIALTAAVVGALTASLLGTGTVSTGTAAPAPSSVRTDVVTLAAGPGTLSATSASLTVKQAKAKKLKAKKARALKVKRYKARVKRIAKKYPRTAAKTMMTTRGYSKKQQRCVINLWNKESNWRWWADNPSSSAYGIPQALPGSKMRSAGKDWRTNPVTQIKWGLRYIKDRHGSPCGAWGHSKARGWY